MTAGPAWTAFGQRAAEVAAAFGLGEPTGPMTVVARGQQGRVWRLVTEAGAYAVKQLIVPTEPADAELDVALQEHVLATGLVPMPRPLRTAVGEVLAEVAGDLVRAYTWVDLEPTDTGRDPAEVGALVAAVHRAAADGPGGPVHPWYDAPVGAARWAELAELATRAKAPFVEVLRAEIPHLVALEAEIRPRRRVQVCHRDLWADNVLPTSQGGLCVIDWENGGLEDPARELPMLLLDVGRGDPARMSTLYAAYRDAGGPARLVDRSDFTMVIAQFGHFWEAAIVRWLDPRADATERDRQLDRIEELTSPPLRVADLDQVLESVR